MKKLLLASTALVMSAGVAAAEVALSGSAQMGIVYDSSATDELSFNTEMGVTFTMSGETDGGLAFGAKFGAKDAVDADSGEAGTVFISGEFGKLSMGDVDSAADAIVGHIDGVGLTGLEDLNEIEYIGIGTAPGALYEYSIDGFSIAAGIGQIDESDRVISIAAGYSFEGFTVGLGYEDEDGGPDQVSISAAYSMDMLTVKAIYADHSTDGDSYGLSVSGSFDATTVTAFASRDTDEDTNFGVGAAYDLGGGAELVGGIARDGTADATLADFGLSFKF